MLPVVLYLVSAAAAGTAVLLARSDRRHRPVAALFVLGLVADLADVVLEPAGGWKHPLMGSARTAFHVAELLHAAYPVAVLAAAVAVLLRPGEVGRRLRVLLGAVGGVYGAVLVLGYGPLELWDGRLWRVYVLAEVVVVAGLVGVVARWAWGGGWRRRPESAAEVVALWAAGVELLNLAGPYVQGSRLWFPLATGSYTVFYVVAVAVQVRWLLRRR